MSTERILAEMVSILDRKSQRLKLILDLTRRQGVLLSDGSIEKLADILQIKQECMEDIDRLDKLYNARYKSYSEHIDEIRKKSETDSSVAALMGRLQDGIAVIEGYLKQISDADSQNHLKAGNLIDSIRNNLQTVERDKRAAVVYGNYYNAPKTVFDKQK